MNQAGYIAIAERPQPPISNGLLGMILLVGTETILFSCFIGAYLVLRMGSTSWPPSGTPPLHIGLSAVNTSLLTLSAFFAFAYRQAMSRNNLSRVRFFLSATLSLGVVFLILQGVEFHRLYARGLTLQTGPYGAVFFSLITCHGLHVLGGLLFLGTVLAHLATHPSTDRLAKIRDWVKYSEVYWYFVAAVWLALFSILYIL
jgi:heme/copper-type cytochrome/quinol oxidase subunit 3